MQPRNFVVWLIFPRNKMVPLKSIPQTESIPELFEEMVFDF